MSKNILNTKLDTDTTKIVRFGIGVIVAVFVIFGTWMSFAPLAIYSVASGKISADLNKKTVQHLEGGIVENIYVKDGDFVKKGDLLLKLSPIQIKAQLDIYQAQYQDTLATYSRLKAQKDNLKKLEFHQEVVDKDIINSQKNLFNTILISREKEKEINKKQVSQLNQQIQSMQSLLEGKVYKKESIQEEIGELEYLYEKRLVDKVELRKLQREKRALDSETVSVNSEIIKLNEQILEIKTKELLNDEEYRKKVLTEFNDTSTKVLDLKSKIIALEDLLKRTSIVSPSNGYVVGLKIHTEGAVISAGEEIMDIVPDNSDLIVTASLDTTQIDKIKIGLGANVVFSAYNTQKSHTIDGKVIHVSADSFVDYVTSIPYYEVKIALTPLGLEQVKHHKFNLVAGMPAEVMIKTGDRTTLSYLLKPFIDMFRRSFNEE
ncbi:MAG: HlyD family type I secretion periplasmic adaptor subunit [Arcobacteraceae bacterium]|jgi:epimerase transport system membrane fusion protein|nr:HlyD family type I secretion periplasmic adaptor subunit [Arcobacteraceae bacterium]MDY0364484.1 HlyD family type I secretion periplasmic adaptor subunit [Arcobacteraceae bacterium]